MKELRSYQIDIANEAVGILKINKIVYISAQVRL